MSTKLQKWGRELQVKNVPIDQCVSASGGGAVKYPLATTELRYPQTMDHLRVGGWSGNERSVSAICSWLNG